MNRLSAPSPAEQADSAPARSSAGSRSGAVLLAAAELFAGREAHDAREQALFRELALNLLPQTEVKNRRRIACHLVRHPDTPQDVLNALAADEDPLTAYPALCNAPELDADILATKARSGPDSLRKAIAGRRDLTTGILTALAETGGPEVIAVLMERPGLDLDEALVSRLCARPEILSRFGKDLLDRKALTSSHLLTHFPRLGTDLRPEAIASAELASLVELARSGSHRPARPVFKPGLLEQLRVSALAGDSKTFSTGLAYTLGLSEALTQDMVDRDSGETLAICLKALGFSSQDASRTLIRLLGGRLDLQAIRALLDVFGHISAGASLLLINRWTAQENPAHRTSTAKHQPLHADTTAKRQTSDPLWRDLDDIEKLLRFGS
jgi:uncharacterized protein (DUF2336 family)